MRKILRDKGFLFAALVFAIAVFSSSLAWSQEVVSTDYRKLDGFDRLIFNWPKPISFEVGVLNDVLIVKFGARAKIDLETLLDQVSEHAALIRQDDDGKSIRFALRHKIRLHTSGDGGRVAIDFVDFDRSEDP